MLCQWDNFLGRSGSSNLVVKKRRRASLKRFLQKLQKSKHEWLRIWGIRGGKNKNGKRPVKGGLRVENIAGQQFMQLKWWRMFSGTIPLGRIRDGCMECVTSEANENRE